jgi:L-malate glycosyltransferase
MPDTRPVIAPVLHRLYLAGAEVLAADLARRLRDRYTFVFLCLDEVGPLGEALRGEGFEVIDLKRRPGVDWSVARRIHAAVRRHGVTLLHPHQYTPFFYAAASRGPIGLLRGRPKVLFTEHGRHFPDYRRPKRVVANKLLLRRGDRVTAVGHFSKQALVDNEGIWADRIEVIHNGIDIDKFKPVSASPEAAEARAAVRRELGLGDEQPVVLQVARFHPVKDHATSVKAFGEVVKSNTQAVLLLVGDGEKRAEAQALADKLGLADRVRFLGVRSDIPRLMAAADVFVLSSLSEAISVTLLEAMGAALPIAATDVGGNGEVVVHGQTGLLSPRGDAVALGANIVTLLADADLRRRLGDAGRRRLVEQFDERRMHERYARVYEEMLR